MKSPYIVSWSGGKDCTLALHKAISEMGTPYTLLSSVPSDETKTLAHGYRQDILKVQAQALGLPIRFMFFEDGSYRQTYIDTLTELKQHAMIKSVVYGDIYLNEHRDWLMEVCCEVGLEAIFPLWCQPHEAKALFDEYIGLGFQSVIVHARKPFPGKEWLGKTIDKALGDYASDNFCPMGENGEFHSLVINGPCFNYPLQPVFGELLEDDKGYTLPVKQLHTSTKN